VSDAVPASSSAPAPVHAQQGLSLRWIVALALVPIAMLFVALFAMRPLYQLWCRISGTQLRPNNAAVAAAAGVHTGRFIKVYFEANACDGLPVRFWSDDTCQNVEVGVDGKNVYHFHNLSDKVVRFRPVHYVSPINASTKFGMKVCFCFNDQEMQPGEEKSYPVIFTFSPQLDQRIHTVSICYSLFEKTGSESEDQLDQRIKQAVGEKGGVVSPRRGPDPLPSGETGATPATEPKAAPAAEPSAAPGEAKP
jgi:cytochrome c oxidase assembly protein subunit 11